MARILAVDDALDNLVVLKNHLRSVGHEVVACETAEEALDRIASEELFDLFVLDVFLPGMSGFELCRRIRRETDSSETPVLFITGEPGSAERAAQAFELGANDYLHKPVGRAELLARVRVLLELRDALRKVRRSNEELERTVAERTQALQEALADLKRHNDLMRAIVQKLPSAVLSTDLEGHLLGMNGEAERLFGSIEIDSALADGELAVLTQEHWVSGARRLMTLRCVDGEERRFEIERSTLNRDPVRHLFQLVDVTEQERLREDARQREIADLETQVQNLRKQLGGAYQVTEFIGVSPEAARIHKIVGQLRDRNATVLIRGDSGTGKELIAKAIHYDGPLRDKPFVPVHCGAIPPDLAESQFFGHVKGAFTGADRDAPGLFVEAEGGTLFLDEISECDLEVQGKLLRVLQSGEVRPVGSTRVRQVRTRLIAASNRDLWQLVQEGRFREDLFFRLDVVSIEVPPLSKRLDDIPLLALHLLRKQARVAGREKDFEGISREAMQVIESYPWPGNVRELENVFIRAMALSNGPVVQVEDLPVRLLAHAGFDPSHTLRTLAVPDAASAMSLATQRRAAEARSIERALSECRGNKLEAARKLGIGKSSLYRKLREYRIEYRAEEQELSG